MNLMLLKCDSFVFLRRHPNSVVGAYSLRIQEKKVRAFQFLKLSYVWRVY